MLTPLRTPNTLFASWVLAFSCASCGAGESATAAPALIPRGEGYSLEVLVKAPSRVLVYGVRRFVASRPVTLREFAPAKVDGELEILTTRASFLTTVSGRATAGGYPGAFCTDRWPPPGYGPSYPVDRLTIAAGETVAFTLFVRAKSPGDFVLDGYVLRFEDDSHERTIRTNGGQRVNMHVLGPADSREAPCDAEGNASVWTNPVSVR
jgi:hypothetical protein